MAEVPEYLKEMFYGMAVCMISLFISNWCIFYASILYLFYLPLYISNIMRIYHIYDVLDQALI